MTQKLIACMDVDYRKQGAVAACILFDTWTAATPVDEFVKFLTEVEPYEPGKFYKRELPCLMALLEPVKDQLELVIVDGYVWLQDEQTPGLGAKLWEALGKTIPVIGVAKTKFHTAGEIAVEVMRGESKNPQFVTAVGIAPEVAARHIQEMYGEHRIPVMLKRVDRLCRKTPFQVDGSSVTHKGNSQAVCAA
ncbi:MAG: endonuclease V [Blastocatellia bacterium]|nr:endonuclease V [Blastocatellia bacterium]